MQKLLFELSSTLLASPTYISNSFSNKNWGKIMNPFWSEIIDFQLIGSVIYIRNRNIYLRITQNNPLIRWKKKIKV